MEARVASTFHRRRGVALIEVAVAIIIISTTLIGVLQLYHVGIDRTREANESALALRALTNEIEYLHTLDAESLLARDGQPLRSIPPALRDLPRLTSDVECKAMADTPGLYAVTVSIAYPGATSRPIEKSLTTWIAP